MYPVIRLAWQMFKHRKDAPMDVTGTHVSHHYCLPWDIDLWREMNNGRMLTIYDMGRIPMAARAGLLTVLRQQKWGLAIAGAMPRYRRRIRMFDRIEMQSRLLCWDDKFLYVEQSMWKSNGECASHVIYRAAITGRDGIVPPARALTALNLDRPNPAMPGWVAEWVAAEGHRPWPPERI